MNFKRVVLVAGLIGFIAALSVPCLEASVLWEIQKTLKLETAQRDMTISENGKWIFILTESNEIVVFSSDGRLQDKVPVDKNVARIQAGPSEELLLLSNPVDQTVQVLSLEFVQAINTANSPVRGDADAPVSIVMFAEFQCPYCARMMPVLSEVLERNKGKVKLYFKHYPLRMHNFALSAAVATEVAAKTGEFWEFHDALFDDYDKLSNEKILGIAVALGFNKSKFEKEMKDPALFQKIQADINDGIQAGVNGVPKIFINGRQLKERTLEGFQKLIDTELKKMEHIK